MADQYTTLRVKKTTREVIRQAEEKYKSGPAEALELLLKPVNDNTKQILLTMEIPRFNEISEMTKILYNMNLIPAPSNEYMVDFAISQVMNGLKKQLAVPATVPAQNLLGVQSGNKAFM